MLSETGTINCSRLLIHKTQQRARGTTKQKKLTTKLLPCICIL